MPFWTYMLHCADRTFYVGHTDDLEKRVGQHELGLVPGYTSTRRPVKLVWSEAFPTRDEARQAEQQIKGWGQPKKRALIRGDWKLIAALAKGGQEGASTSSAKSGSGFLHPHLDRLPTEPFALEAHAARRGDRLDLRYRLTGPLDMIRIPDPAPSERTDELWRHTCFEAFLKSPEEAGYLEFNLSPSSRWAAYRFDAHREGMRALALPPPRIRCKQDRYSLALAARLTMPCLAEALHLNLTAVIEEKSGRTSYWALAHPAEGPPDFHDPACFVLELPPHQPEPSPRT